MVDRFLQVVQLDCLVDTVELSWAVPELSSSSLAYMLRQSMDSSEPSASDSIVPVGDPADVSVGGPTIVSVDGAGGDSGREDESAV